MKPFEEFREPVTGQEVADFTGDGADEGAVALAEESVKVVTAMARSYTRGRGFGITGDVTEDLAAVIVTASARLMANPDQLRSQVGAVSLYNGFNGFSLAETFVLNRYRKRAQ